MKVLLVNGSPRAAGCTFTALSEVAKTLEAEGIATEIFQLGAKPVQDCIACMKCRELGKCVFDDAANLLIEKARESDGFVFGSPVYYAHPPGRIQSVLDRAFYAGKYAFIGKPGASIVSARRGGTAASFDVVNKYDAQPWAQYGLSAQMHRGRPRGGHSRAQTGNRALYKLYPLICRADRRPTEEISIRVRSAETRSKSLPASAC